MLWVVVEVQIWHEILREKKNKCALIGMHMCSINRHDYLDTKNDLHTIIIIFKKTFAEDNRKLFLVIMCKALKY